MQLSPRVMVAATLLPLVASTASARIGIEQQQVDYLFRFFSDSDDVHVWSHFGSYAVDLGPRISIQLNRETVVVPAIGAPAGSPEAIDAITTASRPISSTADAFEDYAKVRNEVQGDIAFGGLAVGYYVSDEEDYHAQQVRASYNQDLFNQNLNVSVGSSYGWDEILPLVDEDTEAFNGILTAHRLPSNTAEDSEARAAAIEAATRRAIEVPLAIMEAAVKVFYDLRDRGYEKPPATSELLNWIGALERSGTMPDPKKPPLMGGLLKRSSDIQAFRSGESGPKRYL